MTFCPSCGAKRKEGSKFCHNCGYDFKRLDSSRSNGNPNLNSSNSNYNSNADFNSNYNSAIESNPNSGMQANQNSHGAAKVLGYIFAILIPIIGIVFGIYLLMSENQEVHKHGKYIIIIAVVIQLLSFLTMLS